MSKDINILVVDDNDENLIIVSAFLKEVGYKIALAFDGPSALKISQKVRVDLILLDVMMPEMDGYEVCRILKADPQRADIPVIFLTAKTETEDVVEGFSAGGVDYITKPFSKEELRMRVRTHLELSESKRTIRKQSEVLAKANKQITDSLNYASGIQKEMLQTPSVIRDVFPNSFLLFRPKDVLSGDFYWMSRHGSECIMAVADCTGHGVPGALISIMGITLLNQMPKSSIEAGPAAMLEYMREHIKRALNQQSMDSSVTDGLEMGILYVNCERQEARFAGARLGLKHVTASGQINTLRGDAMPVAVWLREGPFTQQTLKFAANDRLFMFTDGFIDQFVWSSKEQSSEKQLDELFLETSSLPLAEQQQAVQSKLNTWSANGEQLDDITLVGLHV